MRVILQRVSRATVRIEGQEVGTIATGLLVLAGFAPTDTTADLVWMAGKLVRLRIFPDVVGKMNRSVLDIGGGILVVSQFTLYAITEGKRPSFTAAARPEVAIPLYEAFLTRLASDLGRPIQCGRFGADMQVDLVNDGPVTLSLDSQAR